MFVYNVHAIRTVKPLLNDVGYNRHKEIILALNSQRLSGMWLGVIQLDPNPVLKKRSTLKGEWGHFPLGRQNFQTTNICMQRNVDKQI